MTAATRAARTSQPTALLVARIKAFFDHYVKGAGRQPTMGVTAIRQTCPKTAPSGGPYHAATWAALHPGEVDYSSKPAQTIRSTAGEPDDRQDVRSGLRWRRVRDRACDQPGRRRRELPAAGGDRFRLHAARVPDGDRRLNVTGKFAYIAARLLDVNPATNTETLVARGVYRIDPKAPNGLQVFQLMRRVALRGRSRPEARAARPGHAIHAPSNGVFSISVSNLQLRLPVHEVPGAPGTPPVVKKPLPIVTPHPMP